MFGAFGAITGAVVIAVVVTTVCFSCLGWFLVAIVLFCCGFAKNR